MVSEGANSHFHSQLLGEACARYGLTLGDVRLIRRNKNLVYDCGDRIIKVSHSDERDSLSLEAELDWMMFLRENSLPIVDVLPSSRGRRLERIDAERGHFSAVCYEKIDGTRIQPEDWGPAHFTRLGSILGKMHRLGTSYHPKADFEYKTWQQINEFHAIQHAPDDDRKLAVLYEVI